MIHQNFVTSILEKWIKIDKKESKYLSLVLGKSKLTLFLFIIFTFIVANVNIGSDKSVKASPFLPISVTIVTHGDIIGDIT